MANKSTSFSPPSRDVWSPRGEFPRVSDAVLALPEVSCGFSCFSWSMRHLTGTRYAWNIYKMCTAYRFWKNLYLLYVITIHKTHQQEIVFFMDLENFQLKWYGKTGEKKKTSRLNYMYLTDMALIFLTEIQILFKHWHKIGRKYQQMVTENQPILQISRQMEFLWKEAAGDFPSSSELARGSRWQSGSHMTNAKLLAALLLETSPGVLPPLLWCPRPHHESKWWMMSVSMEIEVRLEYLFVKVILIMFAISYVQPVCHFHYFLSPP